MIVNGRPQEVIGVLPREFKFLETTPAMVLPFGFNRAATQAQDFSYRGLARLKPDVSMEQANRDVARMIKLMPLKFPMSAALYNRVLEDEGADRHRPRLL